MARLKFKSCLFVNILLVLNLNTKANINSNWNKINSNKIDSELLNESNLISSRNLFTFSKEASFLNKKLHENDKGKKEAVLCSLGGIVWLEDDGGNSIYDGPPENAVFGIDVQLWSDTNCDNIGEDLLEQTTISNPLAGYLFSDLDEGCYIIKIPSIEFISGSPLNGVVLVDGYEDANIVVDNDNNGYLDIDMGVRTASIVLVGDCTNGVNQESEIDFGFKFGCNTLNSLAAEDCSEADIICNLSILDGFCEQMTSNVTENGPSPLCDGFGEPNNISWFTFVAGDGSWSFHLEPFACTGDGVEFGIFDSCDWDNNIFCKSDCNGTDPISISSSLFMPGQTYFMFLDGCNGSVCSYSIDILGNFIEPSLEPEDLCILEQGGTPCEDIIICSGKDLTFEVLGLPVNIEFTWVYTTLSGAPLSPDGNQTEENFVTINFPEVGVYEICMTFAFNGCQGSTTPVCRTVTVEEYPDEIFMDQFICTKDFPYTGPELEDPNMDGEIGWFGQAIGILNPNGEVITEEVTSANGCLYDQTVRVFELENERVDVIISSCGDTTILGIPITMNFSNIPFDIPNAAINGCDSLINLTATILSIQGEIEPQGCNDGLGYLGISNMYTLPDTGTANLNLSYSWLDSNGEEIGTEETLAVNENGTYCLSIFMEYLGANCEFDLGCIEVNQNDFYPSQAILDDWTNVVCEGKINDTLSISNYDENNMYNWAINGGSILSGQGSNSIVIAWDVGFLSYEVCVNTTNGCGEGLDTCVTLVLAEAYESTITASNLEICQGEEITLSFDFVGGQGPYHVVWTNGTLNNIMDGHIVKVTPNDTTNYKIITVIDSNGCLSLLDTLSQVTINVDACSSTNDFIVRQNISLFPNPAMQLLKVSHLSDQITFNWRIINNTGTAVLNGESVNEIYISSLPSGLYFVIINIENVDYIKKFIKL